MSYAFTYAVAKTARSKLEREAGRADHNLRFLIGHANLLDTLLVRLGDSRLPLEPEARAHSNAGVPASPEAPRHVRWLDAIEEDCEEGEDDSDDREDDIYEIFWQGKNVDEDKMAETESSTPSLFDLPDLLDDWDSDSEEEEEEEEMQTPRRQPCSQQPWLRASKAQVHVGSESRRIGQMVQQVCVVGA